MRPMRRVTLIALTSAVWLAICFVVAVFLVSPAFESEPDDQPPVTLVPKLLVPAEAMRLGEPPALDWPKAPACPESLAAECAGGQVALVATVNMPRESVVTGAFAPVFAARVLPVAGQRGEVVRVGWRDGRDGDKRVGDVCPSGLI
jgi:hypothetical protein